LILTGHSQNVAVKYFCLPVLSNCLLMQKTFLSFIAVLVIYSSTISITNLKMILPPSLLLI